MIYMMILKKKLELKILRKLIKMEFSYKNQAYSVGFYSKIGFYSKKYDFLNEYELSLERDDYSMRIGLFISSKNEEKILRKAKEIIDKQEEMKLNIRKKDSEKITTAQLIREYSKKWPKMSREQIIDYIEDVH